MQWQQWMREVLVQCNGLFCVNAQRNPLSVFASEPDEARPRCHKIRTTQSSAIGFDIIMRCKKEAIIHQNSSHSHSVQSEDNNCIYLTLVPPYLCVMLE